MFVVTQLWNEPGISQDDLVIQILATTLNSAHTAWAHTPLHILRPVFLWLRQNKVVMTCVERLLNVLQSVSADETLSIDLPPFNGSCTPELKREFKDSLASHLCGWDSFLALRMRFAVADHCWTLAKGDPRIQNMYGEIAHSLLNMIFHRIQRVLIRHLKAIVPILTAGDVPFVMRVVVQATLPGSPVGLSTEAQELAMEVNNIGTDNPQIGHSEELCPACRTVISLQDLTGATCCNGHVWRRCSITTFILSTSTVRTCIACSRKALLPFSGDSGMIQSHLPMGARGWVVTELLRAVQRCLFCGNSFVSVA